MDARSGSRMFPEGCDTFEFTNSALRRVCNIAADVAVQQKSCTAGEISALLYIAQTTLENTEADYISRLERLLVDLERVCSWQQPPGNGGPSIIPNLAQPRTYRLEQQAEEAARRGISAFVIAPDVVKASYLKKLRHFLKRYSTSDDKKMTAKLPRTDPDEYPHHVNSTLYSVLRNHSSCNCDLPSGYIGPGKRHSARLRLRGAAAKQDGYATFDMLFSATPASFEHWQDIQLLVSMSKGKKAVTYGDDLGKKAAMKPGRVLKPGSFCALIGSRLGSRLCLRLQDSDLLQLYEGSPILQNVEPGPSISLRRLLQTHRLSNKMKLVLSYIVAKSFWQYYDSPWMTAGWSSETIHFLYEPPSGRNPNSAGDLYACRPYYSVDFDHENEESLEYCDSFAVIYRYPRLLALCIILIDIGRGRSFDPAADGPFEARINANWNVAKRLVEDTRTWGDFDYPDYRDTIRKCLDNKVFDQSSTPVGPNLECLDHDIEARRRILYETIVAPLDDMIRQLGFANALDSIEPIDLHAPGPNHSLPAIDSLPAMNDLVISNQQDRDTERSKQWLDGILDINQYMYTSYPPAIKSIPPVKVAILDTGYDEDAPFFLVRSRSRQVKGWMDFTGAKASDPVDESGHGTHTLALAMKMAPLAHFYVARIARDRDSLKDAPPAICKAIEWATEVCKADIISMSFGFLEEIREISVSIRQAEISRADQILFLAAASNSGGNRKEMFPASHDSVISIRQTNAQGAFSDTNPPVDSHGPAVYGTLGLSVPSAWRRNMGGELAKSGSSVSTAVAAGIAAMMLSFANVGLSQSMFHRPGDISKLWTRRGMLALFSKMSEDMGNRSMFLSPLKFFSERDAVRCWAVMVDVCR